MVRNIRRKGYLLLKRISSMVLALLNIIILSPLFLIIMLWIVIDDGFPIIFKQKRVGKDKTYFNIYKFRTMKNSAPHNMPTHLLDHPEQYITRPGRFLRKTSLDELPQLFNILYGQLDIVGPRPALWNQYDLIAERDKYGANDIRPGLTGWAQVNGRDELGIEEKARLDGEYIRKMGLFMDLKCLFRTIHVVSKADGYQEGKAEVE